MLNSVLSVSSGQAIAHRISPAAIGTDRRKEPAEAAVLFRDCETWPRAKYFIALPETPSENTPVLVTVHGISRNAREHAETFARYCNILGWAVVAPLFTESCFPRYQRLGFDRSRDYPRSDLALNAILDDVAARSCVRTERIYMFGYSGGGQFAHRYAMIHPHRIRSLALGAPGWYTFPDHRAPFPRGQRLDARSAGFQLDIQSMLRVPTAVFVGEHDTERDEPLRTTRKIDHQQGRTRSERGRRWIAAMRRAARNQGLGARYDYCELAGCGHDFTECISRGQLDIRVLDFLIRARASATLPAA